MELTEVDPAEEGSHPPGGEALWNESWYFDAVAPDGSLGAYHRIGLLPNAGTCLISTCVVRPGKPAVMLATSVDLPASAGGAPRVEAEDVTAEHECNRPLEFFRVQVGGSAQAFSDHAAPLRREQGEPAMVGLDLVWETHGTPYRWPRSTRYELPCIVRGMLNVDGEWFELAGPGQRDHSWGARDWWASDWMWCALHLEDGTHVHTVTVPGHPNFTVGYVQAGGVVADVEAASSEADVADDGLVTAGRIAVTAGGQETDLALEPLAFGAVVLDAEDGRVSHFPRAMCRVTATDGRAGVGWVEWNRNRR